VGPLSSEIAERFTAPWHPWHDRAAPRRASTCVRGFLELQLRNDRFEVVSYERAEAAAACGGSRHVRTRTV